LTESGASCGRVDESTGRTAETLGTTGMRGGIIEIGGPGGNR
jgi:hypothetical protein